MWFEFDLTKRGLKWLGNLRISSRFLNLRNFVLFNGFENARNVIQMVITCLFSKKLRKLPSDRGLCPQTPIHNTVELHQFAQQAARIATFFKQDHFNFWCKSLRKTPDNEYVACPPLKKFLRAPLDAGAIN